METKEYFEKLTDLQNDHVHPEFHTFTTVWMKSRMPERYAELMSQYRVIEGEIYAQYQCDDAASPEIPF
jgi:hypothetical protein